MSEPLTTKIAIRDKTGRVVDEKEVATYAGLLARAHSEGLRSIDTTLVLVPAEDNLFTCVVRATVETDKGTFTGIGDANPGNVGRKIAPHIIRMAETRAKARALRDAVNVGTVSLEELGDLTADAPPRDNVRHMRARPGDAGGNSDGRRRDDRAREPMTKAQGGLIRRLLSELGVPADEHEAFVLTLAEVERVRDISKHHASRLIDRLKDGGVRRGA